MEFNIFSPLFNTTRRGLFCRLSNLVFMSVQPSVCTWEWEGNGEKSTSQRYMSLNLLQESLTLDSVIDFTMVLKKKHFVYLPMQKSSSNTLWVPLFHCRFYHLNESSSRYFSAPFFVDLMVEKSDEALCSKYTTCHSQFNFMDYWLRVAEKKIERCKSSKQHWEAKRRQWEILLPTLFPLPTQTKIPGLISQRQWFKTKHSNKHNIAKGK